MNCECTSVRNFPTKAEKIVALKEYKNALENEITGVKERIKDLESNE